MPQNQMWWLFSHREKPKLHPVAFFLAKTGSVGVVSLTGGSTQVTRTYNTSSQPRDWTPVRHTGPSSSPASASHFTQGPRTPSRLSFSHVRSSSPFEHSEECFLHKSLFLEALTWNIDRETKNRLTSSSEQEIWCSLYTFCTSNQWDWAQFLPRGEYAQNSLRHSATNITRFQCILGYRLTLFQWNTNPMNSKFQQSCGKMLINT